MQINIVMFYQCKPNYQTSMAVCSYTKHNFNTIEINPHTSQSLLRWWVNSLATFLPLSQQSVMRNTQTTSQMYSQQILDVYIKSLSTKVSARCEPKDTKTETTTSNCSWKFSHSFAVFAKKICHWNVLELLLVLHAKQCRNLETLLCVYFFHIWAKSIDSVMFFLFCGYSFFKPRPTTGLG